MKANDKNLTEALDRLLEEAFAEYAAEQNEAPVLSDTCPADELSLIMRDVRARRAPRRKWLRRAGAVAAAVVVVTVIFAVNTKAFASFRTAVTEWFDTHLSITTNPDDVPAQASVYDFEIGYIPAGFELTEKLEEEETRKYVYTSEDGGYISVLIRTGGTEYGFDNEYSEISEIEINGCPGYLLIHDAEHNAGVSASAVLYMDNGVDIQVIAFLDQNEVVKVATGICKNK